MDEEGRANLTIIIMKTATGCQVFHVQFLYHLMVMKPSKVFNIPHSGFEKLSLKSYVLYSGWHNEGQYCDLNPNLSPKPMCSHPHPLSHFPSCLNSGLSIFQEVLG